MRITSSDPDATAAGPQPKLHLPTYDLRLMAEAVRLHETASELPDADRAEAAARDAGGDLEQRIVTRAEWLDSALDMSGALAQVRSAVRLAVSVLMLVAALAGTGAVQAAMGPGADNVVNFFSLIVTTLGIATASLAGWLVIVAVGRGRAGAVGRLVTAAPDALRYGLTADRSISLPCAP